MGRILGYIYKSIYYCCKSFPALLHDVMVGGWIPSWVWTLYYVLVYCCSTVLLLYCCCTGLRVGRWVLSCRVLLSCVHTGSWVYLFLFRPLCRPRAGIVKRAACDCYSGPDRSIRTVPNEEKKRRDSRHLSMTKYHDSWLSIPNDNSWYVTFYVTFRDIFKL